MDDERVKFALRRRFSVRQRNIWNYGLDEKLDEAKFFEKWMEQARAHPEFANLSDAQLEGALLEGAVLKRADLQNAHLEGANLETARPIDPGCRETNSGPLSQWMRSGAPRCATARLRTSTTWVDLKP
ncbi:MAG: pentapeptide repeat-containing protein [Candidatus Cybelea sp.]